MHHSSRTGLPVRIRPDPSSSSLLPASQISIYPQRDVREGLRNVDLFDKPAWGPYESDDDDDGAHWALATLANHSTVSSDPKSCSKSGVGCNEEHL